MSSYKIPLKKLQWKRLFQKIIIGWIHVICIACCLSCAVIMCISTWHFIFFGGYILYEPNIFISIIKFIATIVAIHYCCYLFIKVLKR